MFSKDMTEDKMTFEARKMSRATRVITCKVSTETSVLVRACGEVLSVHTPSRSWQLLLSGPGTARRQQLRPRSDVSAEVSLCWSVRDSGVVEVVTDLANLCLAIHESAILAIDGPKMKISTTLGFLSMLRIKKTRNTSSS